MDFGPISQVTLASLLAGPSDSEKIFRGLNLLKKKKEGLTQVRLSASQAPFSTPQYSVCLVAFHYENEQNRNLVDNQAG